MGLQATFNLADLFIIGKLPNGVVAIGALAICDMIAVIGTILTQGISNAAVAIVSRFFGRNDRAGLNHAAWSSITIVMVLSLVFGIIGLFGADLLIGDMVGAGGNVRPIAVSYLQILVGNSWTIFFLLHLTALMRAMGNAKWPTIILIGANVLNVFLDIFMVYGPGPAPEYFAWATDISAALGIPRMGVNGAAWATVIARGAGCLAAVIILFRFKSGPRFIWSEVRPKRKELTRLLRIGAPTSAQFLVRIGAVVVCLSIVARIFSSPEDSTVLAAFGICIRLDMLALFMGMGWASAAQTFVGINLGGAQPERAQRAGWIAAGYNSVAMLGLAVLYLALAPQIIGLFNDQPEVVRVGREYLWVVGPTYAFIGIAVVLSNALQGATETMSSFIIDAIVILGIQIPLMMVFCIQLDLPRTYIWYSVAGANVLSAFVYAFWFQRGRWKDRAL
jgi:putative MATE family efflux protein